MKKTFFALAFALVTISAMGQNFDFQKDEDNNPFISGQIDYDCSAGTAWNRVVDYIKSVYIAENNEITYNEESHIITVTGCKENSKLRFNPFSGASGEYILYTLTLNQDDAGNIYYMIDNLSLNSQGAGFANYNKNQSVRVILRDYNKAIDAMNSPDTQKDELSKAKNTAKDLKVSLEKAYEVLMNRIEAIQKEVE